jgi:hypothetical protein
MANPATSRITPARVLILLGIVPVLAIGAWTYIAWNWVTTSAAPPADAARAFEAARHAHAGELPVLTLEDGAVVRRPPPDAPREAPSDLLVLVYHRSTGRLVRAEVPFWFLRMKGPASERLLRGAGIDLQEFGLAVDDLARYGPSLVFDGVRGEDRVLLVTR